MAVLLGALGALAMPPVHALPVLLVSLPALVWLMDGARTRRAAFGAGWWWGLGHFSAGFYWISHALLIEPEKFGWMIPFAVFGLGGVIAVFVGLATLGTWMTRTQGWGRILVLAALWTLFEWLRSWVLTGFPWNLLGSVWVAVPPVMQFAALLGTYGLSLLTVLALAMPAVLADPPGPRRHWRPVVASALLLVAVAAWGVARLAGAGTDMVEGVTLRLVQAHVDQANKWAPEQRARHLQQHLELSRGPGWDKVTHVIWPETATPYLLDWDENARAALSSVAPPDGLVITGVPRTTGPGVEPYQVWNSLQAVNGGAQLVGSFDKFHLVPFGEYVPLRGLLPLAKITHGSTDFSAGPGPQTVTLPGLPPVSPLICYEVIFPAAVVSDQSGRAKWLLNLTNDGWFGISAGPHQHFASSRLRAVEEGLPLVRAANTGISAVVDPYGRIVARLGLGQRGVVDAPLPKELAETTTYGRTGNAGVLILLGLTFLMGLRAGRLF